MGLGETLALSSVRSGIRRMPLLTELSKCVALQSINMSPRWG